MERSVVRGLHLPELGLGTAQFGNLYRETSEEEVRSAIVEAFDAGIDYFDTAPHYGLGLSERRLGEQLRGFARGDYVISTKVGRLLEPSPETAHLQDAEGFVVPAATRRRFDFSRDGVLRSVEASLDRLGLDHIDIVYLHDPDDHFDAASTTGIGALIELRDQGTVRAVGAGMNQSHLLAELIRRADLDIVMVAGRYTLLDQDAATDLLPTADAHGVAVVAAGVYNSGLLSRPHPAADAMYDYRPAPSELLERAMAIAQICQRHGVSLPDAAIAFPLQHPSVVSVVVGARSGSQVIDARDRYRNRPPAALWEELRAAGLL